MMNILNKIKISYSTYILLLFALLAGYVKNMFIIILIVIVHELGHVFFFSLFNIEIEKITIYPYGGMTVVNKKLHERIYKDLLISMGGVIFQIILFFIFYFLYENGLIVSSTYNSFIFYNMNIIIFNMIPIIPLDGSKFMFGLFSKFLSYKDSYIMMILLGIVSLIMFIIYNFVYKLNDIVLYVFLICKLVEVLKEFKYVMNKFYLERVMYDHYYNEIISDKEHLGDLRIDKYYYFKDDNRFINEKDYIRKKYH